MGYPREEKGGSQGGDLRAQGRGAASDSIHITHGFAERKGCYGPAS